MSAYTYCSPYSNIVRCNGDTCSRGEYCLSNRCLVTDRERICVDQDYTCDDWFYSVGAEYCATLGSELDPFCDSYNCQILEGTSLDCVKDHDATKNLCLEIHCKDDYECQSDYCDGELQTCKLFDKDKCEAYHGIDGYRCDREPCESSIDCSGYDLGECNSLSKVCSIAFNEGESTYGAAEEAAKAQVETQYRDYSQPAQSSYKSYYYSGTSNRESSYCCNPLNCADTCDEGLDLLTIIGLSLLGLSVISTIAVWCMK